MTQFLFRCNYTGCGETETQAVVAKADLPFYGIKEVRLYLCAEHAQQLREGRHGFTSVSFVRDEPSDEPPRVP